MHRRAFLSSALLLWPSGVSAELKGFYLSLVGRAERATKAEEYSGQFHKLLGAIPNLSPAEAEYVNREYRDALAASGGKFSQRLLRLMDSKEYNVREARNWALQIAAHANAVPDTSTVASEVFHWSKISSFMLDRAGAMCVYELKKLGILKDKDMPLDAGSVATEDLFLGNMALLAKLIIDNVVSPYLEGKLP